MNDLSIGEQIKKARKEHHWTLEQLGERVGVDKSTILKWENGTVANMRRDKISALIKALNLEPAAFMSCGDIKDGGTLLTADESKLIYVYRTISEDGKKSLLAQAEMHAKVFGNEKDK